MRVMLPRGREAARRPKFADSKAINTLIKYIQNDIKTVSFTFDITQV